jgi:hypothetical protein
VTSLDAEGRSKRAAEGQLANRLGSVPAGLRPFGVRNRIRERHWNCRNRRIDLDIALAGEDRDSLTDHGRLGLAAAVQQAAAAGSHGRADHHRNSKSSQSAHYQSY